MYPLVRVAPMWRLPERVAPLQVEYDTVLEEIHQAFPASRTIQKYGTAYTQTAAEYFSIIHPTSWTKFGNSFLTPEESVVIAARWNPNNAYGDVCALYSGRTTSAIEGQNNALLKEGIRDCQVFGAMLLFCNLVAESLADKKGRCLQLDERKPHRDTSREAHV
ncbi:unnamed protein product [Phytophthora fragariaefolia]|uniref:Unnamed protein product n=1 Tax=Phytophthora fragariaefolia TaxID=1490495 RepID=A0A9W6XLU1_9STRA|nr:unnamed protein product [Phytophthora fragariaefolia]